MAPETLGPGSIVMAEPGNFDHYFLESLVLIVQHDERGTKGVLLNHGTPWTVEDLAPGQLEQFAASKVFLGGDAGRDTMMMVHGEEMLPGAEEIGNGAYKGGVSSAVKAVAVGALPAERFKFFYKTVEFLPNALAAQIASGVYRVIELSPAWLFGQFGQRSMWQDVRKKLERAEAREIRAKGGTVAPPSEDELVSGAVRGAPTGLPYEAAGLAEEASRAAARMRQAKVRAYVEQIKRENAKRWPNGRPLPEGATASTEPVPIAYDAAAQAGGSPADMQAAEAAAAEEEERERAETFTVNQPTAAEVAAKATSWLASQGITAPPAKSDGGAGTAAADAAAGTAAAGAAAADAAADVQPASASGIE